MDTSKSLIDQIRHLDLNGVNEEHLIQTGPCVIIKVGERFITICDGEFSQIFMDENDEVDSQIMKRCEELIEEEDLISAVRWVVKEVSTNQECPGFEQLDGDDNSSDSEDNIQALLPDFDHDPERKLTITTWGVNQKGEGGRAPTNSQLNVNASVFVHRRRG